MALIHDLRKELQRLGDPRKAPEMQAYMKSPMPFHGVSKPARAKLCREFFKTVELGSPTEWKKIVLGLWRPARFREERYCALALAADKRAIPFHTPDAMPLFEELIVSGAWWDYVDEIASHRVGRVLREFPRVTKKQMLTWSRDKNLWKRRTSILCQLGSKADTDLDLLYRCIEPSLDSSEFFLRKAIGWALRQYAWTDPKEIQRYVKTHQSRLSPLSRREALKNL
jgi:3-methyladenine DNA glycosylase AlkD